MDTERLGDFADALRAICHESQDHQGTLECLAHGLGWLMMGDGRSNFVR